MRYFPGLVAMILLLHQPGGLAHPGAHATLDHFSQKIEAEPDNQKLYIQRGMAYSNDGQYEKALADYRRAEQLGEPVVVAFALGVLYYRTGEFDTSRGYFDTFLQQFPDHARCLEYRARLARDAGDYASAIADFRRLFQLPVQAHPGHYISAAQMLQSMGPSGGEEALLILDQGNEQLGMTPQLQRYAIELELQGQRPDRAIARLYDLQQMLGDTPEWKVEMAVLLAQTGEPERARQMLRDASSQLRTLRKTPARLAVQERIDQLTASLNSSG